MIKSANDLFFGMHLYKKNYISFKTLFKANEIQRILNKKMGDWVIELGYLNKEQVTSIYNEQKITNNYFGEIAIKNGFLTEEKIEKIIKLQKESNTSLDEIIRLFNYISDEDFEKEAKLFISNEEKRAQKAHSFIKDALKDFDQLNLVVNAAEHTFYRMLFLPMKISETISYAENIKLKHKMFEVNFSGEINFSLFYNFNREFGDDAVYSFFESYPKKKVLEMYDSVLQELANIVSGVIATDLSNLKDISVKISVPSVVLKKELSFENKKIINIPFLTPFGEIDLNIVL